MSTIAPLPPLLPPPLSPSVDEPLYEIIDGRKVELPPMSAYASILASLLVSKVNHFAETRNLGIAVNEVLFHLSLPVDRNRRPDGAYVSYQRWPRGKPMPLQDNAWDVVPNLAIEVISPSDTVEELLDKLDEYFRSRVDLVWVVYPRHQIVQAFQSLTDIRVCTRKDDLDGGKVLPEFRLSLASLFQEELPSL